MIQLAVKPRGSESAEELRASGFVPAVCYGPTESPRPIAIEAQAIKGAWHDAGETTMIHLTGLDEEKDVLFRDVQVHPVSDIILHVDFYIPEKGKKVEVTVPLVFSGTAPAEKAGHVLVKALHEIDIAVLPAELPHELVVDISKLENIGDHVTAGQITLPPSAELQTDSHEIIVSVTGVEVEADPAQVAPVAASEDAAAVPQTAPEEKGPVHK